MRFSQFIVAIGCCLTIQAAPIITTQPQAVEVPAGCPVTFTVTASGTAPLAYQWYLAGDAIADGTVSRYIFTPEYQTAEPAEYFVVVTNASGAVTSAVATIYVTEPGDCAPLALPVIRIGGRQVSLMVKAETFLPLALTRAVMTLISGITNDTLAAAARVAVHPRGGLGWGGAGCGKTTNMPLSLITNAWWSNTFAFRHCVGVGACVQGWYSNAEPCSDALLQNRGVLVTRRHFVTQGHICTPVAGTLARFIGTNNQVHLARIQQTVCGNWSAGSAPWVDYIRSNTSPPDTFAVAQFTEDVPADVEVVRVWPADTWQYVMNDRMRFGWATVATCQDNYYLVGSGGVFGWPGEPLVAGLVVVNTMDVSRLPEALRICEIGTRGGDSGSPSFSVLDGVMVGGVGSLHSFRDPVEATIMYLWTNNGGSAETCPGFELADLSGYQKLR